jgi:hypothetical protein
MSGKHEPPTNRSFYLSVGTSNPRFAIKEHHEMRFI